MHDPKISKKFHRDKCNPPNAIRQKIKCSFEDFSSIHCKFHTASCGIHFAKTIPQTGQIKLESFMTTQESKLAKKLEHRLQEIALETKKNIYRSEVKSEVNNMVRTSLRLHQQTIPRAQYYTGDA
jgi:hypothetical protein